MNPRVILFFGIIFLNIILIQTCKAQTAYPPSNMEVYMAVAPNDTNNLQNYDDSLFSNLTHLKATMVFTLQDTVNVINIHIKLGTTLGSSDLLNKVFAFNVSGSFPDNTSFFRENEVVYLGLGNFIGVNTYYAEAKLEYSNGVFSQIVYFNN